VIGFWRKYSITLKCL